MRRRSLLPLLLLPLFSQALAIEPPARQLAHELLTMSGTAAVLDSPKARAALGDPMPFLGETGLLRRERLLEEAGLRRWQPPRLWLLQARREGEVERWQNVAAQFQAGAAARGYTLTDTVPLPAAEQAISLLAPGTSPVGLASLLGAYGADALVLIRGEDWSLWTPRVSLQGRLAPHQGALLPQVLAEVMAGLQQWPEAPGQSVVEVSGVQEFADQAGVQQAFQAIPGLRQARLIRVGKGRAWYAVAAPGREALGLALDGEPRLPPEASSKPSIAFPGMAEARQLASPLLRREWKPAEAPQLPEGQVPPLQSTQPSR